MGEATELVCILARKNAADHGDAPTREWTVETTRAVLYAHGAHWDAEAENLFLHEDGGDPELEPLDYYLDSILTAEDEREGLARILEWPTMGCLDGYAAAGVGFAVEFCAYPGKAVRNVTLHVPSAVRDYADALAWFVSVGRALHRELRSGRTFMAWGLGLKRGFTIDEEYARLCNGEKGAFEFEYLDLCRVG